VKETLFSSAEQGVHVGELGATLLTYFRLHGSEGELVPLGPFQLQVQLEDGQQTILTVTGEGILPIYFTIYDGMGCHNALNLNGQYEEICSLLPALHQDSCE
jgi:hypothetical protein